MRWRRDKGHRKITFKVAIKNIKNTQIIVFNDNIILNLYFDEYHPFKMYILVSFIKLKLTKLYELKQKT